MALPWCPPFVILFALVWTFSRSTSSSFRCHQQKVIPTILGIRYSSTYIVALKSILQLKSHFLVGCQVPTFPSSAFSGRRGGIKTLLTLICFVLTSRRVYVVPTLCSLRHQHPVNPQTKFDLVGRAGGGGGPFKSTKSMLIPNITFRRYELGQPSSLKSHVKPSGFLEKITFISQNSFEV